MSAGQAPPTPPAPVTTEPAATTAPSATTASTVAPAPLPAPDDQPFFNGGDWITLAIGLIAATIAYLSYRASAKSAGQAERAAKANEDMVVEQKNANRIAAEEIAILRQQRSEAQVEADARVADQARLVRCKVTNMGGLQVAIQNMCPQPVTTLRLVNVVGTPDDWTWQLNPRVGNNRMISDVLQPGQDRRFFLEFLDDSGEIHRSAGDSYAVTFRFTDARGRRWERVSGSTPRQVPNSDADLEEEPDTAP